uniref:ATP-dependent helicase Rep n=1 Tax=Diporeia sp. associated circular virus TaxID=1299317 RepID=M1T805_9VIRU|nr:replication-associated protein [Diporeia sp. associated circular virus]
MSRNRNYVFTLNNYTPVHEITLNSIPHRYLVYGREVAPTTNTPHLQGYICFPNAKTISAVRRILAGCHVEVARGSHAQCRTYCIKDGDFYEHGDLPADPREIGNAEADRWEDAWEKAKAGAIEEIPADIRIRSYSVLRRIGRDYQPNLALLPATCGYWIKGESGAGKSHSCFTAYPDLYPKGPSKWWCGYQNEEVVLLDDVDPSHGLWIGGFLKRWADKYPFIGESKGGSFKIRPKKFIVTSQYSIEDCFQDVETRVALNRRFRVINKLADQAIII